MQFKPTYYSITGPGSIQQNPAASCHLLLTKFELIPDGDYWIKGYDKEKFCGRKGKNNSVLYMMVQNGCLWGLCS